MGNAFEQRGLRMLRKYGTASDQTVTGVDTPDGVDQISAQAAVKDPWDQADEQDLQEETQER